MNSLASKAELLIIAYFNNVEAIVFYFKDSKWQSASQKCLFSI
jgi:hypothetical protein